MNNILTRTLLAGGSTLGAAYFLQYMYKKTNFYPPNPVFWFAIGSTAHLALEAASFVSKKPLQITGGR